MQQSHQDGAHERQGRQSRIARNDLAPLPVYGEPLLECDERRFEYLTDERWTDARIAETGGRPNDKRCPTRREGRRADRARWRSNRTAR